MTSKFPDWHVMLIIPILFMQKYQKIGSCRFKNDILLYLASVTNVSIIHQEVLLHCAIFDTSDPEVWKFQKIEFPKRLYTKHCQYRWKCNKILFLHLKLPWTKKIRGKWYKLYHYHGSNYVCHEILLWKISKILTEMSSWNFP